MTSVEIIDIKKETETDSTFRVKSAFKPNYGQFFQVSLPGYGEAPISISGFGDGWLDLTIRNAGKLTGRIHELGKGESLFIRGPYGNGFDRNIFFGKHLVIVAGGTGVAPVRSLIDHFVRTPDELEHLDLLFGFKNPESILFKDEIMRWKNKTSVILTVDQACGVWEGECTGLVTDYVKHIDIKDFSNINVIIVGPPMMMKYTADEFIRRDVKPENIYVSLERNMSCGIGKCGHCKIDDTYICIDGPVFNYKKAMNLKD
jgi:anaerobic sulfite reductase subunit B